MPLAERPSLPPPAPIGSGARPSSADSARSWSSSHRDSLVVRATPSRFPGAEPLPTGWLRTPANERSAELTRVTEYGRALDRQWPASAFLTSATMITHGKHDRPEEEAAGPNRPRPCLGVPGAPSSSPIHSRTMSSSVGDGSTSTGTVHRSGDGRRAAELRQRGAKVRSVEGAPTNQSTGHTEGVEVGKRQTECRPPDQPAGAQSDPCLWSRARPPGRQAARRRRTGPWRWPRVLPRASSPVA